MEETVKEMKRNYRENLNPHDYHRFCELTFSDPDNLLIRSLTPMYELIKSGNFKGSKLLEIGSGATVHNIASASLQFTEIVQSDFVEANCEELRKWLRGEPSLDWSHILRTVAKIEGYDDLNAGCQEIEARIRKCVKAVVHCDLLVDQVIPPEVTTEYDLIVTSLTVEAVATDLECYVTILKRLNRLLRPGGGLVMIGFLNGGKWKTAGGEFHHLHVSQADVDQALDVAGFAQKQWTVFPKSEGSLDYEHDGYYFLAAAKM